jgi:hypothetical protein
MTLSKFESLTFHAPLFVFNLQKSSPYIDSRAISSSSCFSSYCDFTSVLTAGLRPGKLYSEDVMGSFFALFHGLVGAIFEVSGSSACSKLENQRGLRSRSYVSSRRLRGHYSGSILVSICLGSRDLRMSYQVCA